MKKSKLSRNVAPEYCAERRYVSLATALAVASMASKVTTVDTGNMISSSGRKERNQDKRERKSSIEKKVWEECASKECVDSVQYLD